MDPSNSWKPIEFDQGWEIVQEGLRKLENLVAGKPDSQFTSEEYMMLYEIIYDMCTQKGFYDHSQRLYDKYKETFEEYLSSVVLPSLQEKHDPEPLLREFVKRWSNHKVMMKWKLRFFNYLDRYFIQRRCLPDLSTVGFNCFRELVYANINGDVRDAVCFMIDQEREGEQIDQALLKDVVNVFVEIGVNEMNYYEDDFEAKLLENAAAYYSQKQASLNLENSSLDYTLKVQEWLKLETDRVSNYLPPSTKPKLLERVRQALLATSET